MTNGPNGVPEPQPEDLRYPSVGRDPRELRSRRANGIAALTLVGLLIVIVLAVALFG